MKETLLFVCDHSCCKTPVKGKQVAYATLDRSSLTTAEEKHKQKQNRYKQKVIP